MDKLKPMTVEDCAKQLKVIARFNQEDAKTTVDIMTEYHKDINMIIAIIENKAKSRIRYARDMFRKTRDNKYKDIEEEAEAETIELHRLKNVLKLAPTEEIFLRTIPKMWISKEYILARNKDFFIKQDFSHLIKKDERQELIENLVDLFKSNALSMSDSEINKYWDRSIQLIGLIARFKKIYRKYV